MGSARIGKSTVLNRLGANFQTSRAVTSRTKIFQNDDTSAGIRLIYSPGLHDLEMKLDEWATKLNTSELKGSPLNLCLLCFKCTYRPNENDIQNVMVMQEAVKAIKPEHIGIVFTHCDTNPEWDHY